MIFVAATAVPLPAALDAEVRPNHYVVRDANRQQLAYVNLTVPSNLVYFSFVTLTSVGYGDIVPLHPVVRGIANVEAIIGQLYPATLLARLVTLELEHRRP